MDSRRQLLTKSFTTALFVVATLFLLPPTWAQQPPQASASAAPENYQMGPGDGLSINVYDTPELSIEARINESGEINYPLLGTVMLDGLTEIQAADKIAKQLKQKNLIKDPNVTVTVDTFQSRRVTVVGAVPNPGEYFLSDQRSVTDLLGKAGWIKPDGADYLLLTRKENGQEKQMRLSLSDVTSGPQRSMQVQAGDVLFVPKEEKFYIQGAVKEPGAYRLTENMTVIEALSIGGGLTPRGSRSRIELKRRDDAGKVKSYDAELEDAIKPNDTIYVKERLF